MSLACHAVVLARPYTARALIYVCIALAVAAVAVKHRHVGPEPQVVFQWAGFTTQLMIDLPSSQQLQAALVGPPTESHRDFVETLMSQVFSSIFVSDQPAIAAYFTCAV